MLQSDQPHLSIDRASKLRNVRKSVSKNTDNHAILTHQWEPISDQKIAIINMESSCPLIDVKTQQKSAFLL